MDTVLISLGFDTPTPYKIGHEPASITAQMNLTKFQTKQLPPFFDYISYGKVIRSTLNCSIDIMFWMHKYSEITSTNWVVLKKWKSNSCFLHRVEYACYPSAQGPKKSYRNVDCRAKILITIKSPTETELNKDPYLQAGFGCKMQYINAHNHPLNVSDTCSTLNPSDELRETFERYFDLGMDIKESIAYHKVNCKDLYERDGNGARPNFIAIRYLYTQWRLKQSRVRPQFADDISDFDIKTLDLSITDVSRNDCDDTDFDINMGTYSSASVMTADKSTGTCPSLFLGSILEQFSVANHAEVSNEVFVELIMIVLRSFSDTDSNDAKIGIWNVLLKYVIKMAGSTGKFDFL